jgi:hypothetical protein
MEIRHRLTCSHPALLLEFPGMESGSFNSFLAAALGLLPAPSAVQARANHLRLAPRRGTRPETGKRTGHQLALQKESP